MSISLETFYKNFRKLDYHDLKIAIEQTNKISQANKEMVEKYYDFYETLKYKKKKIVKI